MVVRRIAALSGLLALGFILFPALPSWSGWQRDAVCQGSCGGGCPCSRERVQRERPDKEEESEHSQHVDAYNNANRLWRDGNYAGAEQGFRRALALEPGDPATLRNLAAVIAAQGRFAEAEPLLLQANQSQPTASGYTSLAYVLSNLNRMKEADEAERTAIQIDASSDVAHSNLRIIRENRAIVASNIANAMRNARYSQTLGQLQSMADNVKAAGMPSRREAQKFYTSYCFDVDKDACAASARILGGAPTVVEVIKALQTNPAVPERVRLKKPEIKAWESVRDASRERLTAVRAREAEAKAAPKPEPAVAERLRSEAFRNETAVAGANATIIAKTVEYTFDD